jgi:hypothetical protein
MSRNERVLTQFLSSYGEERDCGKIKMVPQGESIHQN